MRKVFVPCLPTRHDAATNRQVPSVDLNPASSYGELVICVEGPVDKADVNDAIAKVRSIIISEARPGDVIIAVGDHVLVAAAIAHMPAHDTGVSVLRWDPRRRRYDELAVML
jgi:hypothetical protein